MRIAVCDDRADDRSQLTGLIQLYCQRHNIQAKVDAFATGEAMLKQMKRTAYSIAFLDIFLEEEHGVELAQYIRRQNYGCDLFFCTISKDFALDGFQLNALHYLVKPISYRDVEAALNRCDQRLRQADQAGIPGIRGQKDRRSGAAPLTSSQETPDFLRRFFFVCPAIIWKQINFQNPLTIERIFNYNIVERQINYSITALPQ